MYLKAIIIAVVLMSGLGIQAGLSHAETAGSIVFGNLPSMNVSLPENISYNLTYLGIVYIPANSSTQYFNNFASDNWHYSLSSNGTMSYHSNFLVRGGMGMEDHNAPSNSLNPLSVSLFLNFTPVKATPSISSSSSSLNFSNFSPYTYYKITTWIYASGSTTGGTISLLISFGGRDDGFDTTGGDFHGLGMMGGDPEKQQFNGYFMNNSHFPALFWWNNSYTLNGAPEIFRSAYGNNFGQEIEHKAISFAFNLSDNNSNSVIYEDPYIATAGIGITDLPPTTIAESVVSFVLAHAELLAAGAATGSALIALPYLGYRRRRVI
ncbi:MAG: hypothetical protein B2I17_07140 [Thermoplasmatales archaeon B_DKE]|nr:MAG: hypothetical protein B2I17_07140 [Thermoplasmatales archaeon B_DKE]